MRGHPHCRPCRKPCTKISRTSMLAKSPRTFVERIDRRKRPASKRATGIRAGEVITCPTLLIVFPSHSTQAEKTARGGGRPAFLDTVNGCEPKGKSSMVE